MRISNNIQAVPQEGLTGSAIYEGDAYTILKAIPSNSIQCVVTSPPYWGLRDYKMPNQIGLEPTLPLFIENLSLVFEEVRRVLRDDGVVWLNLGDGYTSGNRKWRAPDRKNPLRAMGERPDTPEWLKPKDLLGIPWRVAFALQDAGWYLRADIIWHKPNAMPESVRDRPSRAHEYLFMFTKNEKYYYDKGSLTDDGRSIRSVWNMNTQPSGEGHPAAFPLSLVKPCISSSTKEEDYILDPFMGSGTVGLVAIESKRNFIGIELNPTFLGIADKKLSQRIEIIRKE